MAQISASDSLSQIHEQQKQRAAALLKESLERLNAIRFRVHQTINSKTPNAAASIRTFHEELVEFTDNSQLMTAVAGRTRAYFFSCADSWIYLERDAGSDSNTLVIVKDTTHGAKIQKTVC
ncbi:hypothetical protein L596_015867 [Steinernema carpocapsae]|uniref:Uncharacterized protein n=1 Tax=Steinernema carpocapsae TaxID=34508 RepID=A0A4U5NGW7_STECR|nr:hypothetical protein L596_015867 [Steinernema carpocapsae]